MLLHASILTVITLSAGQPADTLDDVRSAKKALSDYYYRNAVGNPSGRPVISWTEYGERLGWQCSAEEGQVCTGGDWARGYCRANTLCHPSHDFLAHGLVELAAKPEASGFVTGQAVGLLVRLGRALEAMQVVEDCSAANWWCEALRAHVLQSVESPEAPRHWERFLAEAPDSVVCSLDDATWLVGRWSWIDVRLDLRPPEAREERWSGQPCSVRAAASDTIWWLADPLYVLEGNDRRLENLDRALDATWRLEIEDASSEIAGKGVWPQRAWDAIWPSITRRGPWDSFALPRSAPRTAQGGSFWTSKQAARYHFVPDFEDDDLSRPTWRLEADLDDEGYTPPYAPFYTVPVQVARFRKPDADATALAATALRTAIASSVAGTPIDTAATSAHLIFTDAPESFPLHLEAPFRDGRVVFLPEAPPERFVTSLEILTPDVIGWHRQMLEPLEIDGPGLSDILLYEPQGFEEPDSLLHAASMMFGTTELEDVPEVGLYWEVYGAEAGSPIEFELQIERESGGFIQTLRRLLPGGPQVGGERLAWDESATGPVSPRAIVLDLRSMDDGAYTIVVRARWPGQEGVVETRRRVVIR